MKKSNSIMQFIKDFWKSVYLFILGIFWISYILYIRLILKRHDYSLVDLQINFTWTSVFFDIFFVVLHLVFLISALYRIYVDYKIVYKKDPNFKGDLPTFRIIKNLQLLVNYLFINPLEFIRDFLAPKIPGFDHLLYLFRFYARKYNFYTKGYWLVFIFYILPRVIVATIFFVEIVFYHQIYYFVRSLIILIIPLIWIVLIDLLNARAQRGFKLIQQYFDIEPIGEAGNIGIHEEGYYLFPKEGYFCDDACLASFKNEMEVCIDSVRLSIGLLTVYKMISLPYVTLYCSSLYIMGFGYKLLFVLT